MREGWVEATLGDLIERRRDFTPVAPNEEYVIVGVQRSGWGFVRRDSIKGREQKFERLMQLVEDDLVYRTITAFEAPSAVAGPDEAGLFVTPQTFPVFKINAGRLLPPYMRLFTTSPQFHEEMASRCTGTVLRRKTLSIGAFESIPVDLPTLVEQRRIVDLIGVVDDAIKAATNVIEASSQARGYLLEGLLARLPEETETRPLGELGEFIRGRRFVKSDYVEEGLGVIHYGQIHTHYGAVATKALSFIPQEMRSRMRLASTGDVVIACTSENVEDLGKATVWLGEDDVAVHDDCQIFRHRLDPRFASHLFATADFHHQKVQYAAGTKVTRISADNLRRIAVPVPGQEDQEAIGATMSDLDAALDATGEERSSLRTLRSNLLTALLSGEHEIPESYDELVEEAVST